MKLFKVALLILILVASFALASPSWADRTKVSKNPDYVQVTKSLESLQAMTDIPEDVQRQIDELQLQKTAMESGMTWGQCSNQTGQTLAIYGPVEEKGSSSELYFLANGQSTPEEWDCAGVYLPSETKVAGLEKTGAMALKILDGTQLIVSKNAETNELEFNIPPAEILSADQTDWLIPNLSVAFVNSRIPSTLSSEIND